MSPCQQILAVLNRNLADLDDTLRDIQNVLGLHLRQILSKACLREALRLFGRGNFPFTQMSLPTLIPLCNFNKLKSFQNLYKPFA